MVLGLIRQEKSLDKFGVNHLKGKFNRFRLK